MKNIFLLILTVLLIISIGFNIKFNNEINAYNNVILASNQELVSNNSEKIEIENVFKFNEINYVVSSAKYSPATPWCWHIHEDGQLLYVVSGYGFYQEENEKVKKIKKGDIIYTKPGVKSWHGSTQDDDLVIITISPYSEHVVKILEPVNKVYYDDINEEG